MTLAPPTDPGLIWITLSDGRKVLGYWDQFTGYRRIGHLAKRDLSYMSHVPKEDISRAPMVLPLMDVDVVAWRPHEPEGEVSWEVEALINGGWQRLGPTNSRAHAEHEKVEATKLDYVEDARVVEVTRRVVEP